MIPRTQNRGSGLTDAHAPSADILPLRQAESGTDRLESHCSREFTLLVACCRWPLSEAAIDRIRDIAKGDVDWAGFVRLIPRHRVGGLVFNAMKRSALETPHEVRGSLAKQAQQIARRSIALTAETLRLQGAFDDAGIPSLVLKGAPLAQVAYGSQALKQGRDVDIAVSPARAADAFRVLEDFGYRLVLPARELSEAQRRVVVRFGNEAEFVHAHNQLRVDLHWQLAYNPALLKNIGAHSPAHPVDIPGFGCARTLRQDDHFAYLCVHGAYHRWSRLKWIADLNAFLCAEACPDILTLYRHACESGAGLCARQALLLAHRLFALPLPAVLRQEIEACSRARDLTGLALQALTQETSQELSFVRHFQLGEGTAYILSQLRIVCVGLPDAIRFPLPPSLHFIYPMMRLPMMLWRRINRSRA